MKRNIDHSRLSSAISKLLSLILYLHSITPPNSQTKPNQTKPQQFNTSKQHYHPNSHSTLKSKMCVCDTKSTEIWEPPKPVNIPKFIYNGDRYKRPSTLQRWENRWNGIGNGPGGKRMYGRGGRRRRGGDRVGGSHVAGANCGM